jgi:hypothetical protein
LTLSIPLSLPPINLLVIILFILFEWIAWTQKPFGQDFHVDHTEHDDLVSLCSRRVQLVSSVV